MNKNRANSRHTETRRDTWRTLHYKGITYPNYIISIDGRIKHVYSGKDLKMYRSGSNGRYLDMVSVYGRNGKQQTHVRVSRAMIETWYGMELAEGIEVHHIDGDHENHTLNNLMPVTKEEHDRIHGRNPRKAW